MSSYRYRPVVLIVRDGWGANPHPEWNHANAVHLARKPVDDRLMATYPHVLIKTSGRDVGLPDGTMGNSEVGHQNIGAGRIVEQEIMRITGRIEDGMFFENPVLVGAFEHARKTGGGVHLMGLCSNGQVHSDLDHLYALMDLSGRLRFPGDRVWIHAFTDGRDTPPFSGVDFLRQIDERCHKIGINPVASVCGRYWAMDRDHRWDRVEKAYGMLTGRGGLAHASVFPSADGAMRHYYDHPAGDSMKGDEFIPPSVVFQSRDGERAHAAKLEADSPPPGPPPGRIRDGDAVIFFNFRGDRPRELVQAFTFDEFPFDGVDKTGRKKRMGFDRGPKLDLYFATMTEYEKGLPVHVAFPKPGKMKDIFGEVVSRLGLRQFRCAETEKYPHVTFFFNDYRDEPFPSEERQMVQSPRDVATYDQKPGMSAYEVTRVMLERIAAGVDDAMILNFANPDMVGHTGSLSAAIRAVEVVDECVGRIVDAVLACGGALIVTADHGNCEQMIDPATGGPHTAHTTYPVECLVVGKGLERDASPIAEGQPARPVHLREGGRLADIAPTLLELMGVEIPEPMTGRSLLH
ncbi:MAG: 2,3-bisphosphoglycerate-independent phosphoglycerate mutase [Phycisphaerae bacterium]|nr:MAG: 2,3-bisphosphoglycerate-independent phosphoglycerate mutase [Planctomycetota bacterium]KAB2950017.1 MAG: 2,3-bisphosphoglycerate-independent phosphoglycerate mutase [Phycisphaerae bacterium]MBE7458336.1 2,3-bisphosphoglycerate-independent phosphoglycerate mutase [Planctomycetia bacterium]MCK6465780.1 2,3-bisphosphoglycerate-independent phosphoglycerate mutase [Phycisphaerae bacterium]MCL4719291.1 2,3-bisphosphoglycerate-independent phosphoglycerate mutase [Phycisphaerae bacterium]